MVRYNFKNIQKVAPAKQLVDIILSNTQRKTPTEVHPQFQIGRIREFYIRKVKFTQKSINEKLTIIIDDFPRLEDIHPFFGDLLNILYDKDHYKLALGQVNSCRHMVNKIGRDYVQFIKYGDSAYRCKRLKVAALGRMATLLRKLTGLEYLEKVRQHLARLPQIDPSGRTLLLTGMPNVGKSSFINGITKAKVDVQDYPFTTQSLFVGHYVRQGLQWQVIDTPGVLDHPLEDRNTIEMQSINALAHLQCTVVFMVDISESVYSIEMQMNLFKSLSPLFRNKPVVIAATKNDLTSFESLGEDKRKMMTQIRNKLDNKLVPVVPVSNITQNGVENLKEVGSQLLLNTRVKNKMSKGGQMADNVLRKLYVSRPEKRDNKDRPAVILPSFQLPEKEREERKKRKILPIDLEREMGYGNYQLDQREHYLLAKDEWKNDVIPEMMDGKNILDFYDPKIEQNLEALRREEDARMEMVEPLDLLDDDFMVDPSVMGFFDEIEKKQKLHKKESLLKNTNRPLIPRKYRKVPIGEIKQGLMDRGVNLDILENVQKESERVGRSKSRNRSNRSKSRSGNPSVAVQPRSISQARNQSNQAERMEKMERSVLGKRNRALGIGDEMSGSRYTTRSLSSSGKFGGLSDPKLQMKAVFMGFKKRKVLTRAKTAKKQFEADRHVYDYKPKHLFSGKMGFKRDWR